MKPSQNAHLLKGLCPKYAKNSYSSTTRKQLIKTANPKGQLIQEATQGADGHIVCHDTIADQTRSPRHTPVRTTRIPNPTAHAPARTRGSGILVRGRGHATRGSHAEDRLAASSRPKHSLSNYLAIMLLRIYPSGLKTVSTNNRQLYSQLLRIKATEMPCRGEQIKCGASRPGDVMRH